MEDNYQKIVNDANMLAKSLTNMMDNVQNIVSTGLEKDGEEFAKALEDNSVPEKLKDIEGQVKNALKDFKI